MHFCCTSQKKKRFSNCRIKGLLDSTSSLQMQQNPLVKTEGKLYETRVHEALLLGEDLKPCQADKSLLHIPPDGCPAITSPTRFAHNTPLKSAQKKGTAASSSPRERIPVTFVAYSSSVLTAIISNYQELHHSFHCVVQIIKLRGVKCVIEGFPCERISLSLYLPAIRENPAKTNEAHRLFHSLVRRSTHSTDNTTRANSPIYPHSSEYYYHSISIRSLRVLRCLWRHGAPR